MNRIQCKYSDWVLIPSNAIDDRYDLHDIITLDGVHCKGQLVTTWNNANGFFDEELHDFCMYHWGLPFASLKEVFTRRIGKISDVWDSIHLEKL